MAEKRNGKQHRVVLTGGPGGGKTTAADLFRRELGDCVVIVPEAATLLFSGGFPRVTQSEAVLHSQKAIYCVQRQIEDVQASIYPDRLLLCDRGTVDGGAYWPEKHGDFFSTVHSTIEEELERYDAVVFFETAAAGGISIEGGNPIRSENIEEAVWLDRKLQSLWSQHPNYTFVGHQSSFFKKMTFGLAVIENRVKELKLKQQI